MRCLRNLTKCHSFSDWTIMAAFEGVATGRGFDVGLSNNIFHLSSSLSWLHLSQAISVLDKVCSLRYLFWRRMEKLSLSRWSMPC